MSLVEYLGRFHPALVHIPIGVFLGIILLEVLALRAKFKNLLPATRVLFMLGFVAACVAAITGYLHAESENFDDVLVNRHLILGISVAIVSFIAIIFNGGATKHARQIYYGSLAALGLLTVLAGHTGASITYGPNYLSPANISREVVAPLSNLTKDAHLYVDLVKPVLENKCISCHGPSRQKGKLRLDEPDFIKRGGEDGAVVNVALPDEGELWRRITLESSNDDHMPPSEKPQLSRGEIGLIMYWLQNGADFNAMLGALPKSDSIIAALTATSTTENTVQTHVAMPDEKVLSKLTRSGVAVSFLSRGDGRVALQFINAAGDSISSLMGALSGISAQVVEMKIPRHQLSHADWKKLSEVPNLQRLSLENSNFSDEDVAAIGALTKLEYLNLVGTSVTVSGLAQISLPQLKHLYLFRTNVSEAEIVNLKEHFPSAELIPGKYQVPTLRSDTTEQKEKYVVPENR
jgi:uncharacterized membrane protein